MSQQLENILSNLHETSFDKQDIKQSYEAFVASASGVFTKSHLLGNLGDTASIDLNNGQVQYGKLTDNTLIILPATTANYQEFKLILYLLLVLVTLLLIHEAGW